MGVHPDTTTNLVRCPNDRTARDPVVVSRCAPAAAMRRILIDKARREVDPKLRKPLYAEVQRILAEELPSINLWYLDNVLVHNRRVRNLQLNPAGNYDFLRTAELGADKN